MTLTRKEQIFQACERLKEQGITAKEDFGIRNIERVCTELNFPKGNFQYLRKYRDEWLDTNLQASAESSHIISVTSASAITPTIERVINEQREKVEQELSIKYREEINLLKQEKNAISSKLEDVQINEDELANLLEQAQKEVEEKRALFSEFQKQNNEMAQELGMVRMERDVFKEDLSAASEKKEKALSEKDERYQAQLTDKDKMIDSLLAQLNSIKCEHQEKEGKLLQINESQRHEAVALQDKLETELKNLRIETKNQRQKLGQLEADLENQRIEHELASSFQVDVQRISQDIELNRDYQKTVLMNIKDDIDKILTKVISNYREEKENI